MAALISFAEFHVRLILLYSCITVSFSQKEMAVQVSVGDAVLLPCIHRNPLPSEVTVSWRDRDDRTVLDIEDNVPNLQSQDSEFKGRVTSFIDEYKKGNFSILLQDARKLDAGDYDCHVRVSEGSKQKILLSVTDKRVEVAVTPPGPAGGAAVTSTSIQLLLLCCLYDVL